MEPRTTNHLDGEKSPYLKQHVNNPVDWYPWNTTTLEKAAKENKPIFLSIGYSTCHWCHVMAKESFENKQVAQVLNNAFVCIKVDREERPDLDLIYMQVCQMLNGNGGWPLNVILTPDLKPIFAATYLSPDNLIALTSRVNNLWAKDQKKLKNSAETLNSFLKKAPAKRDDNFLPKLDRIAWQNLRREFDEKNGGFGSAPKFPVSQRLLFLLHYWYMSPDPEVMNVIDTTLRQMRCGGIYDQLGGGFHRYSIDQAWKVPHFEKMLYDQAMLAMLYTEAAAATGNSLFADTAKETIDYTLRRLQSPQGSFYAAEDADERYYLWTTNELRTILSTGEFDMATKIYNLRQEGNFTPESGDRGEKLNILYLSSPLPVLAAKISADPSIIINLDNHLRMELLKVRAQRPAPHRDEKIITGWNGLMIVALAKAGRTFDQPQYLNAAVLAADNILLRHINNDQSLTRCVIDDQPGGKAILDDYAYLIWGFIELYESVFDQKYLAAAIRLSEYANTHFSDTENGGYLEIADNTENILFRPRNSYDSALPSGSSVMMYNQLRLASLTGSVEYARLAERNALSMASAVNSSPQNCAMVLNSWLFARYPAWELVVVGKPDTPDTKKMLKMLSQPFFPFKSIRFYNAADESDPNNREFKMVNGTCTVYICRNQTCQPPVNSAAEVAKILKLKSPPGK